MMKRLIILIACLCSMYSYAQNEPCESHVVFLLDGSSSFNSTNKEDVSNAINSFINNISDNNVFVSVIPLGHSVTENEVYADENNYVLYSNEPSDFEAFFDNYTPNTGNSDINSLSIDRWDSGLTFVEQQLLNSPTMKKPDLVVMYVDEEPVPLNLTDAQICRETANNLIANDVRLFYMVYDNYCGNVRCPDTGNGILDGRDLVALKYTSSDLIGQDIEPDFSVFPSYYLSNDLSNMTDIISNLEDLLVNQNIICDDDSGGDPDPDEDCETHIAFLLDGSSSFNITNKNLVREAIEQFIQDTQDNDVFVSTLSLARSINEGVVYADDNNFVAYSNVLSDFSLFFNNYTNNFTDTNGSHTDFWESGTRFVDEQLIDNPAIRDADIVILFADEFPGPYTDAGGPIARATANSLIDHGVDLFYMILDNGNNTINPRPLSYMPSDDITRDNVPDFSVFPSYYLSPNFDNMVDILSNLEQILEDQDLICEGTDEDCEDCESFKPKPGYNYVLSAWLKEDVAQQVKAYQNSGIAINFLDGNDAILSTTDFTPEGRIIEEWQRIYKEFEIPSNTVSIEIVLKNKSDLPVYFDDIRIHPYNGNMKSFVYDPETQRLMAELDENNYSTFYEYDNEGGLVRVKKETEKGVYTIQETRSKTSIKN